MKAAVIHSFGDSSHIKIEESPRPRVKDKGVLVKIHDAGINPIDWKIREGYRKSANSKFPLILGQDFAGEIVELGSEVTGFKKGDRVFGFAQGAYAEFASVSEDKMALMPNSLDFETAAAIPTAGLTAWQLIVDHANIQEGQKILVHGAAGGVGSIIVQLALWKKANVVATASASDEAYLKDLGVQKVIDYKSMRFEEFVRDVDVVADLVGGDTLSRSYQIMKKGGIALSTVGSVKEEDARTHGVHGINVMMNPNSKDLKELAKLFEAKILKMRKGEVLPLAEAQRAQDLNQKGHTHGRIILKMM